MLSPSDRSINSAKREMSARELEAHVHFKYTRSFRVSFLLLRNFWVIGLTTPTDQQSGYPPLPSRLCSRIPVLLGALIFVMF